MANRENPKKKLNPQPPHVSDMILGSLKSQTGRETSRWIAGLINEPAGDPGKSALPASSSSVGSSLTASTVSFTDRLFDFFQQIEFDFNKTVAGTDCVVTIERPTYFNEKVRLGLQQETVRVFRGRISTRYWTLIIRANNQSIEGWVLPVAQVFGFRCDDNQYPRFFIIEPSVSSTGGACWRINNAEIAWDDTRSVAKQIFAALIRIAKGEAVKTEAFLLATGVEPADTGDFEFTNPRMPKPSLPQPPALLTEPPPLQQPARELSAQPPKTKQTLRGAQTRKSTAGEQTVDSVVAMLNDILNRDLEKLSREGAEAFARQDMATVQKIYGKTLRIKELQEQLMSGITQWKELVKQALNS